MDPRSCESAVCRDYDPTLHRRRSITLPDEPAVTVNSAILLDPCTVYIVDAKSEFDHLFRESTGATVTVQIKSFASLAGACRPQVPKTVARLRQHDRPCICQKTRKQRDDVEVPHNRAAEHRRRRQGVGRTSAIFGKDRVRSKKHR